MEAGLDEHLTERMCIVTRAVHDEDGLIRFVRSPDGYAVPDLQRKLPGRGVWVTLSRQQVSEAVKKNLFSGGLICRGRRHRACETIELLGNWPLPFRWQKGRAGGGREQQGGRHGF
jgi:predicted RNA-binding protein YlxR (DUF448 family)